MSQVLDALVLEENAGIPEGLSRLSENARSARSWCRSPIESDEVEIVVELQDGDWPSVGKTLFHRAPDRGAVSFFGV
jgi:hypothetical protein